MLLALNISLKHGAAVLQTFTAGLACYPISWAAWSSWLLVVLLKRLPALIGLGCRLLRALNMLREGLAQSILASGLIFPDMSMLCPRAWHGQQLSTCCVMPGHCCRHQV